MPAAKCNSLWLLPFAQVGAMVLFTRLGGGGTGVVGGMEPRDLCVLQCTSSLHVVPPGPAVLWCSLVFGLPFNIPCLWL